MKLSLSVFMQPSKTKQSKANEEVMEMMISIIKYPLKRRSSLLLLQWHSLQYLLLKVIEIQNEIETKWRLCNCLIFFEDKMQRDSSGNFKAPLLWASSHLSLVKCEATLELHKYLSQMH